MRPAANGSPDVVGGLLRQQRRTLVGVALFSALINILILNTPLFMLEIYDRVIASRSVETLIGLLVLALGIFVFHGIFEVIRGRILVRSALQLDTGLSPKVFRAATRVPLASPAQGDTLQPFRDLEQIRTFLSGPGPGGFFDLPWMPLYVGICFLFHPLLGIMAGIAVVVLVAVTLLTQVLMRRPMQEAQSASSRRHAFTEEAMRNTEALHALGMMPRFGAIWDSQTWIFGQQQARAAEIGSSLSSVGRVLRLAMQVLMLALGAYLVVIDEATAGIIIASSILLTRALAPVETVIANWRAFIAARESWAQLKHLLAAFPNETAPMKLPAPCESLAAEEIGIVAPGGTAPLVQRITFSLSAGDGLGIIGPSGAGKSSLVRGLVGVWPCARGRIRIDGAAIDQWQMDKLGRHIGYLPQDVELFAGTVADNIARFDPEPDPEAVLRAAQGAGVHKMILKLPGGYDTEIGRGGAVLSAGQRQRVALARALYGEPFIVVLDEPNSNLDSEGEQALMMAIRDIRRRGGIVIIVAHNPSALGAVDHVLMLAGGTQKSFGPKHEVLPRVLRPAGARRGVQLVETSPEQSA